MSCVRCGADSTRSLPGPDGRDLPVCAESSCAAEVRLSGKASRTEREAKQIAGVLLDARKQVRARLLDGYDQVIEPLRAELKKAAFQTGKHIVEIAMRAGAAVDEAGEDEGVKLQILAAAADLTLGRGDA